jgi:hypothetical protein
MVCLSQYIHQVAEAKPSFNRWPEPQRLAVVKVWWIRGTLLLLCMHHSSAQLWFLWPETSAFCVICSLCFFFLSLYNYYCVVLVGCVVTVLLGNKWKGLLHNEIIWNILCTLLHAVEASMYLIEKRIRPKCPNLNYYYYYYYYLRFVCCLKT